MSDRFKAQARFVRALIATNLKAAVALRGNFWLQAAFMFLNNIVYFVFWWVLFDHADSLRGWRSHDVELLFGLCGASFGLMQVLTGGVRHISRWVDEGELDPLLVQPKPTWLYAVLSRSQPSGLGDVLSGTMFILISGHVRWDNAWLAILCVLSSATVFLGAATTFFSCAFWLSRTEQLSRQTLDFLITFSLYPEALFGGMLRVILFTVLPAGFIAYVPVHVLRDGMVSEVPRMLLAALGFLGIGICVFQRGLRRYASGSRFGVWG